MKIWAPQMPFTYLQVDGTLTADQAFALRRAWEEAIQSGRMPILSKDMTLIHLAPPVASWMAWVSMMLSLSTLLWVIFR